MKMDMWAPVHVVRMADGTLHGVADLVPSPIQGLLDDIDRAVLLGASGGADAVGRAVLGLVDRGDDQSPGTHGVAH